MCLVQSFSILISRRHSYPKFENKSLLVFAPTWAYQNVLGTNAFNPQLALRTSGKKVPPSAKYALLSPKARIAVIVLSSIGAFFTLVAALLSCVRCKRQRSRKTEEESPPIEDDEGDMDEEKEQQQGLLNAEAPIGKVDDSPTIKTYDTDSSFAPQYNYSLTVRFRPVNIILRTNWQRSSGYSVYRAIPTIDYVQPRPADLPVPGVLEHCFEVICKEDDVVIRLPSSFQFLY